MTEFVKVGYSKKLLCWLNLVRKHLKVVSLASISTIDGKSIPWMAYLSADGNGFRFEIDWPAAPLVLPPTFVELWQEALCACFGEYLCVKHNLRLPIHCQLGSWLIPDVDDKWLWFFCSPGGLTLQTSWSLLGCLPDLQTAPWRSNYL